MEHTLLLPEGENATLSTGCIISMIIVKNLNKHSNGMAWPECGVMRKYLEVWGRLDTWAAVLLCNSRICLYWMIILFVLIVRSVEYAVVVIHSWRCGSIQGIDVRSKVSPYRNLSMKLSSQQGHRLNTDRIRHSQTVLYSRQLGLSGSLGHRRLAMSTKQRH